MLSVVSNDPFYTRDFYPMIMKYYYKNYWHFQDNRDHKFYVARNNFYVG